jgi:hypothetical protein
MTCRCGYGVPSMRGWANGGAIGPGPLGKPFSACVHRAPRDPSAQTHVALGASVFYFLFCVFQSRLSVFLCVPGPPVQINKIQSGGPLSPSSSKSGRSLSSYRCRYSHAFGPRSPRVPKELASHGRILVPYLDLAWTSSTSAAQGADAGFPTPVQHNAPRTGNEICWTFLSFSLAGPLGCHCHGCTHTQALIFTEK